MYKVLYTSLDLENVVSGETLTPAPLGTMTACSIKILNQSQFGLNLQTSNMTVDHVPPYSWITLPQGMFNSLDVAIDPTITVPTVQPNSFISATTIKGVVMYAVGSVFQPNMDTNITGSSGSLDTNITGSSGVLTTLTSKLSVDPNSGHLPTVQQSNFITFVNPVHRIEFWNLDKNKQIMYINFNQPTSANSNNKDFILLPDPNGNGFGAYYSVAVNGLNGFYYQGGEGQVMGWY